VLKDPPFSHIDLVSCRNLLIYLDRELQGQVCATFHYALRPNGYLFIGSSESIERPGLFTTISREARIFQAAERARELPPLPRGIVTPRIPSLPALAGTYREPKANYATDHR
jgi:two-component system CheB/CheR fusion protein